VLEVVQQTKIGVRGVAYVVNAEGRVIAHPDSGVRKSLRDLSNCDIGCVQRQCLNAGFSPYQRTCLNR
jgi:hypothetical protein